MDDELDVRNVRGRFVRLCIASVIGVVGSIAISLVLPTHWHFDWG